MPNPAHIAINLVEHGYVPDVMVRQSIRWLVRRRLQTLPADAVEAERRFVSMLDGSPVALLPEKANEQHYELPAAFFELCLGRHRKYSCCYWPDDVRNLDEAESVALELTCGHAQLEDGLDILELGCGWGSLTLWMAERYPACRIVAVSNSGSQREYIESQAQARRLRNITVITSDMNDFHTDASFDRIMSVEMFEHMRNYRALLARVASWLRDDGKFFMHIFCHRSTPYEFEDRGATDWMSRHFFSGGIMPSDNLPLYFQDDLELEDRWRWDGRHYEKTADAWLDNMEANRDDIMMVLRDTYGEADAPAWWMRWRMFFFSVAELFGYDQGQQWRVGHYLFRKR